MIEKHIKKWIFCDSAFAKKLSKSSHSNSFTQANSLSETVLPNEEDESKIFKVLRGEIVSKYELLDYSL